MESLQHLSWKISSESPKWWDFPWPLDWIWLPKYPWIEMTHFRLVTTSWYLGSWDRDLIKYRQWDSRIQPFFWGKITLITVDGWNLAPVENEFIPWFTGFGIHPRWLALGFLNHQQWRTWNDLKPSGKVSNREQLPIWSDFPQVFEQHILDPGPSNGCQMVPKGCQFTIP